MDSLYLAVGTVVLLAVVVDVIWTTLWVDGGSGPLSARLTTWTWYGLRRASDDRGLLGVAGPLVLSLTLAMWIGLLWLGWTLLFAGGSPALLSTQTGEPASWTGRIYYVAYTMFTNGNGDYTPAGGVWEIASSFTTATGMAFVTLGISYVVTVLGAVSEKRSFASDVTGLGDRPESFVRTGWDETEGEFGELGLPLESLANDLSLLADKHKAYPVLHYYHSDQPSRASAVAVPILDEALTVLESGVEPADRPDPVLLASARSSVDTYLDTLETAFIDPADEVPPAPDLNRLREDSIGTVEDRTLERAVSEIEDRRRRLLGIARADAWEWPPVGEDESRATTHQPDP
ncbi:potassium channel family protein [Saliphagus sp. LR7]|uniref:potassium channel family protein n=1 Tax=Saliphagus sp. LR7 TaxID=2282654 RepID=UPI000DF8197D|nr:potassium channel family protein [Saliphagus sp. LR7]